MDVNRSRAAQDKYRNISDRLVSKETVIAVITMFAGKWSGSETTILSNAVNFSGSS